MSMVAERTCQECADMGVRTAIGKSWNFSYLFIIDCGNYVLSVKPSSYTSVTKVSIQYEEMFKKKSEFLKIILLNFYWSRYLHWSVKRLCIKNNIILDDLPFIQITNHITIVNKMSGLSFLSIALNCYKTI